MFFVRISTTPFVDSRRCGSVVRKISGGASATAMGVRKLLLALGFLLSVAGYSSAKDCDFQELNVCVRDASMEIGDFDVFSEEQMKELCNTKLKAIQCASNFVNDCMKKGVKDLYEATIGGKLKLVNDMCTDGSIINTGYLENIDCWGKVKEAIQFCNDKYNQSQRALVKGNLEDRLKVFYGCCAFEWHRNCMKKVTRAKCNEEAGEFVYYVSTVLGGTIQDKLCSSSYSSCHSLHGVNQDEVEENLETIVSGAESNLNIQIVATTASFILLHLMVMFYNVIYL